MGGSKDKRKQTACRNLTPLGKQDAGNTSCCYLEARRVGAVGWEPNKKAGAKARRSEIFHEKELRTLVGCVCHGFLKGMLRTWEDHKIFAQMSERSAKILGVTLEGTKP